MVRGNHGGAGERRDRADGGRTDPTGDGKRGVDDGRRERGAAGDGRRDAKVDERRDPETDERRDAGGAICGRFVRGAAFGALAYVVGYALVFVIALVERSGAGADVWTMVGWLFYNAHFVGIEVPITGESVNVLAGGNPTTVPPPVYHLVPPVLLTLAGYLAARSEPSRHRGVIAAAGGGIVAGYLPLAAAGAFVFAFEVPMVGMSLRPDPVASVLLAGIAYPVAFGTASGAVYGLADHGGRAGTVERAAGTHCGNCGEQVAGEDRFCRHCGTDLAG